MSKDIRPAAFIGAMDAEIDRYLKHFKVSMEVVRHYFTFRLAKLGDKNAVIVKSGVGKVFAAMVCERLIEDFRKFMPVVSKNSYKVVSTVLRSL